MKLVLIDGHALIHRAYHALPQLTTSQGENVNAVYGFARMLLKALKDLNPEYVVATFDKKMPTFRHLEFKDYKAKRPPTPPELESQFPLAKKLIKAFNIPYFEMDGYEADDIIGTLVKRMLKKKKLKEIIILTGDMDTLQLVNPRVKVYTARQKISDTIFYDEKKIYERYGISPKQIIDLKALQGDLSDNIPGVKGIGEKTASKLIKEFGSLKEIYQSLEKIDPKTREKLEKNRENAFLSYKLASIVCDVPVKLNLEDARIKNLKTPKVKECLERFEFKSLLKNLFKEKQTRKVKQNGQLSFI